MAAKKRESRIGTIDTIRCGECKRPTRHTIRASHKTSWEIEEGAINGGTTHDLMECNGCGAVTYRAASWFSEEDGEQIALYPPRDDPSPGRQPKDFDSLSFGSPLESVYRQTIAAFNEQLPTLAGAGVRIMIDGICNEKGIANGPVVDNKGNSKKQKNLEGRINGLVEHGLIAKSQAGILHEIRFLGNDSAHELDQPSRQVLGTAIDIVEHLLAQIYEQPEHAKMLAARKRPRKATGKT